MNAVHILLVDDEERLVLNMARLLKARHFFADTAFSGLQALERLSADAADIAVVVLDVRMPGMDGLTTLAHIKKDFPGIEVLMLTGQATLSDGVEALRRGAFDYIQKPCEIDELEAKIRIALSVKRIRRHPVLWPRATAGEIILSGFIPLCPEDPLTHALTIYNRYRHGEGARILFVEDEQRHVQGMLERSRLLQAAAEATHRADITWEWLRRHPECLPPLPVGRIMNRRVAVVNADTTLADAARLMLHHHYDSIPVTAKNGLQGIIRLQDVLRYLPAAESDALDG